MERDPGVLAVLGGLGAAFAFAGATLCSSRSSRMVGPASVLSWVMLVGLLVTAPAAIATGVPEGLTAGAAGWLLLAGAANVAGLLVAYAGLRVGKVGVVAPILSTQGAITAVISMMSGERPGAISLVLLTSIAVGVVLATAARDAPSSDGTSGRSGAPCAIVAALLFGASLYATARASADLPVPWVLLPPRFIGVLAVGVPLAMTGQLRLTRAAVPFLLIGGLCEVVGFSSFSIGSRHGIAVAAVLASLFGAIAGVAAYLLFAERLSRLQFAGVATIVVGVASLTALQA
jgi:drug/metabolite transporter (DMT)-like permease